MVQKDGQWLNSDPEKIDKSKPKKLPSILKELYPTIKEPCYIENIDKAHPSRPAQNGRGGVMPVYPVKLIDAKGDIYSGQLIDTFSLSEVEYLLEVDDLYQE